MNLPKFVNRSSVVVLVLATAILGGVGFLLFKFGGILLFFYVLPTITNSLSTNGGLNHWLAQAIAVGFTVALLIPAYLIIKGKNGNKAIKLLLLVCFMIAAYSLTIFKLQQKTVEVKTVKSVSWGKEKLMVLEKVKVERNTALFDPISGAPRAWYYKHQNGALDIFSGSGKHPQLGVDLKAMDAQTAMLVQEYISSGQAGTMINSDIALPEKKAEKVPPLPDAEIRKKSNLQKPAAAAKESPTQLARKELLFKLGKFGNYLCQAEPNP